ncbi:MAG: ComEC/Rec2 family competence protein [Bacteroidia bacterium]|nr:ComEC/Rec2 family competence protein [Bacteroidia bacterium]
MNEKFYDFFNGLQPFGEAFIFCVAVFLILAGFFNNKNNTIFLVLFFILFLGWICFHDIHRSQFSVIKKNIQIKDTCLLVFKVKEQKRVAEKYTHWEGESICLMKCGKIISLKGKIRFHVASDVLINLNDYMIARIQAEDLFYFYDEVNKKYFLHQLKNGYLLQACFYEDNLKKINTEAKKFDIGDKINRLRNVIADFIHQRMKNKDVASLALAMWVGDERFLSRELYSVFSESGVIHILSVSGMHVGFIYIIMNFLLSKLSLTRKARFILISVLLMFYSFLCGFGAPVLRAVLMFMLVEALYFFPYDTHPKPLLAITAVALVLLIFDPFLIYNISFQLSFSAMAGLLLLNPVVLEAIDIENKSRIGKFIAESLVTTFSASLTTLPFVLAAFQSFTFITFLSNLAVVPISFVFMLSILIVLIPLEFLHHIPVYFGKFLIGVSEYFSSYSEFTSLKHLDFTRWDIFFSVFIIVLLVYALYHKTREYFLLKLILLTLWMFINIVESYQHKYKCFFYAENNKGQLHFLIKNNNQMYACLNDEFTLKEKNLLSMSNFPNLMKSKIGQVKFFDKNYFLNDSVLSRNFNGLDSVYILSTKRKRINLIKKLAEKYHNIRFIYLKKNHHYFCEK